MPQRIAMFVLFSIASGAVEAFEAEGEGFESGVASAAGAVFETLHRNGALRETGLGRDRRGIDAGGRIGDLAVEQIMQDEQSPSDHAGVVAADRKEASL